jgi:hypothetical protein
MTVARSVFFLTLATAITTAVACGDSNSLAPEFQTQAVTGTKDSSNGGGTGTSHDTAHANPDTSHSPGPDTTKTPPPPPVSWPRSVLGVVQGVTYTPGGPDSVTFERVANATVTLYQVVQPTPPNYDSLPPRLYATTTTNAAGEFSFMDLPQAGYVVKVTPPAGSPYKEATVWFTPQEKVWKMGINLYR